MNQQSEPLDNAHAASGYVATEDQHPKATEKPSRKKKYLLTGLLVLLIGGNAAIWAFTYLEDPYIGQILKEVTGPTLAEQYNGFDVSNATVPMDEIYVGATMGAIVGLEAEWVSFVPVSDAYFMDSDEPILGYIENGEAAAYPLKILEWHEVVNDMVGGRPIAATYCPLCGTAMVFDRRVNGTTLNFNISGLLYKEDMVLFDRQTYSLWSQVKTESIAGPMAGAQLTWLPGVHTTWSDWKTRYPQTKVLSVETNFPMQGYHARKFGLYEKQMEDEPKVFGVVIEDTPKAYFLHALAEIEDGVLHDQIAGQALELHYDKEAKSVQVMDAETGEALPGVQAYLFAWQLFHPSSEYHGHHELLDDRIPINREDEGLTEARTREQQAPEPLRSGS